MCVRVEACAGHATSSEYKVARGRIELPTYRFSGGRSYQLSYLAVHLRDRAAQA
jgi:hypothetical protein